MIYLLISHTILTSEREIFSDWDTDTRKIKVKISISDKFLKNRHMLSSFLTQLNTYIQFNWELFTTETEKIIFITVYLQSDALNWFKLTLNNYLNNIMTEREDITNKIFTNFRTFKSKIKVVFKTINKECITERKISLL